MVPVRALVLPLVLAAPLAASAQDRPIVNKVREIQRDVERMRGLKFRAPVKVGVQKPEALQKMLLEDFEKEASLEELAKQEKVVKALGLLPADFRLREQLLSFLGEHIGGFYLPEKKELFLVDRSGGGGMNAMAQQMNDPMVMAHELQHALQDQHFGLDRWFELLADHDDRLQAYKSLTEGEAQLIGMSYMFGKGEREVDLERINRMQEMMMRAMPQGQQLPPYLLENMMFPYTQGAEFFQALKNKVGWEGIAPCFADPPASTEQILHPEKYFGQRDDPTELRLPTGIEKVLGGAEATELYTNTLGEFNVSVLLRALGVGRGAAAKAAAGWDGDTFIGYETQDGRVVVVWLSTWDSAQEASEFEATYRPALGSHSPGAHLERRGTEVLLVLGSSGAEQSLLIRKGFRALKVVERWQPLPGLASTPDDLDLIPEEEAKTRLAAGHVERAPAGTPDSGSSSPGRVSPPAAAQPRLVRLDELEATFSLPAGFASGDDPLGLEARIPSAFFSRGETQLRLIQLPFPVGDDGGAFVEALRDPIKDFKLLEQDRVPLHGAPSHVLLFQGTHRDAKGRTALNALQALDLGDMTLAVIVSVPLRGDPKAGDPKAGDPKAEDRGGDAAELKDVLGQVTATLWLDNAPTLAGGRDPGLAVKEGRERKVKIPVVLERQEAEHAHLFHSQSDERGAKVQIMDGDLVDLGAYSARLEARIPLIAEGAKVHSAGIVQRRGHDVYQIDFEVGGRRTHQMVVRAGGRLWTIACSAPAGSFDAYRWSFGYVFGHFRVRPGTKYTQQQPQPRPERARPTQPQDQPKRRQPY